MNLCIHIFELFDCSLKAVYSIAVTLYNVDLKRIDPDFFN